MLIGLNKRSLNLFMFVGLFKGIPSPQTKYLTYLRFSIPVTTLSCLSACPSQLRWWSTWLSWSPMLEREWDGYLKSERGGDRWWLSWSLMLLERDGYLGFPRLLMSNPFLSDLLMSYNCWFNKIEVSEPIYVCFDILDEFATWFKCLFLHQFISFYFLYIN